MPSTTTVRSIGSAYAYSLRQQAKEELRGEDWSKYSAMTLLNSIKNFGLCGRTEEEAGNLAGAYILFYKATDLLPQIINHPEFRKSQKEKGAVWQEFKAYKPTFISTILEPATRVSERLKAMERQKIDKDEKDAPSVL